MKDKIINVKNTGTFKYQVNHIYFQVDQALLGP